MLALCESPFPLATAAVAAAAAGLTTGLAYGLNGGTTFSC